MRILPLLLFCTLFPSFRAFAQKKAQDFGKISPEDIRMTVYPADSTAKAVVLQDIGTLGVYYDERKGPCTRLYRKKRVKILRKDALDEGNIFIRYSAILNSLTDIEALVTGPTGLQTKVSSEHFRKEKLSDTYNAVKIFLPNIEVGSIIEYSYILEEDGIMQPDKWYFQSELPTVFSKFEFAFPDMYNYVSVRYFHTPPSFEQAKPTNLEASSGFGRSKLTYYTVVFENLPALKEESFMTNVEDQLCRISFQLKSYRDHNGFVRDVFTEWKDVARDLEENMEFGYQYLNRRFAKNMINSFKTEVPNPGSSPEEIAQSALAFLTKHIKWNQLYRWGPTDRGLDDAFKKKEGSSGDLNLALLALLKDQGLEAYPILMSTREHGAYVVDYPILSQFNSVIVGLVVDGKLTIYDATSPYHSANMVSVQHSNYNGWMVKKGDPQWVEIKPISFQETVFFHGVLNADMELEGEMSLRLGGLAGVEFREEYAEESDAGFLKKRYQEPFSEVQISNLKVESTNVTKPVSISYHAKFSKPAQVAGNMVYMPLMIEKFFDQNPFKSLERNFPVQLPYPLKSEYILNLSIPQGYAVEYLPAPTKLTFEGGGPSLHISATKTSEEEVQVKMSFTIKEILFSPAHYPVLRSFFSDLIEKQDQQIVLKKL